jgi:hypothetical protein
VARGTIYNRAAQGTLLAWRQSGGPGLYVPAGQILGTGEVVLGLRELRDIIGEPRLAWSFFRHPQPFADGPHRPLNLLASGRVDDVLGAARSYGSAPL